MYEQDLDAAIELAAIPLPHVLDLLRQVLDVDIGEPARPQQRGRPPRPREEVLVVPGCPRGRDATLGR
jgi:hypothetical protein